MAHRIAAEPVAMLRRPANLPADLARIVVAPEPGDFAILPEDQ